MNRKITAQDCGGTMGHVFFNSRLSRSAMVIYRPLPKIGDRSANQRCSAISIPCGVLSPCRNHMRSQSCKKLKFQNFKNFGFSKFRKFWFSKISIFFCLACMAPDHVGERHLRVADQFSVRKFLARMMVDTMSSRRSC